MTSEQFKRFHQAINTGNAECVEIGDVWGDVYVVGERKKEAAAWLESHTSVLMTKGGYEKAAKVIGECAAKFNVLVGTKY